MAIEEFLIDTNPQVPNGIGVRIASPSVDLPVDVEVQEICFCDIECPYEELAFALPGGTDFENDKSSFEFFRIVDSDIINFFLVKDDTTEIPLVDDTFGEFFDFGSFDQVPNNKSFRIDWLKVFLVHGSGRYNFRAEKLIAGTPIEFISRNFRLELFDIFAARETVVLEFVHNGFIQGGETAFDFRGMTWSKRYRLEGELELPAPQYVNDRYENNNRSFVEIQSRMFKAYKLQTRGIPKSVQDGILYSGLLAPEMFLTDYNLFSQTHDSTPTEVIYKKIAVKAEAPDDPTGFRMSQKGFFILNFTDRKELPLHRNFKG